MRADGLSRPEALERYHEPWHVPGGPERPYVVRTVRLHRALHRVRSAVGGMGQNRG